ncbi:T9SS type A sorting domain-containing protein [Cloacibacterium caeni]|uniref:T9SS type A sorting domain-containing protein n=1 Tax=Cloacibacterium caeni TaxID=2004710 RepID=UPI001BCE06D8|nr:T9SS type A sorting domain-containing protein [Cloacibacterium caeni]
MKTILLFLLPLFSFSQTEIVSNIDFGSSIDFTNQPISPQSDFSKSQVIYYKSDLNFKGLINQIRYLTSFSSISLENSSQWIVKLGTTSIEEFGNGVGFINQSELTEVFNGSIARGSGEVIINFTTPFNYTGTENLVIQVEEIAPGSTSSALSGFKGGENFNNPPKRSIMSLTDSSGTSVLIENSYPATRFFGSLERCISPTFQTGVQNITQSTATINFQNNPLINAYHYSVYPDGTTIPSTLKTTTSNTLNLTNLLPAEKYRFSATSDCDSPAPRYANQTFSTKPLEISVPHIITFDGQYSRDYFLPTGYLGNSSVSAVAADNSTNGLLFRSSDFKLGTPSYTEAGNIWDNNSDYIAQAEFLVDLTNNPVNPIFSFRLKQKLKSNLRVLIDNLQVGWTYRTTTSDDTEFQTVIVDLKKYIGKKFTLTIEHVSDFYSPNNQRSAWVDTIELKEESCSITDQEISISKTTNSITLSGLDSTTLYDIAFVSQALELTDDSWISSTLPYTFQNLSVASPYKIYIRKKCSSKNSKWNEFFVSTLPNIISPPYSVFFTTNTTGQFVSPQFSLFGTVNYTSGNPAVSLHQRGTEITWIGGNNTTESQAWNENKDFISSLFMKVDAQNTTTLNMTVRHRVRRFGTVNNSWFRVLVNGTQIGPSYQGAVNAQYQNLIINLDSYAGTQFTVELQHSGRFEGYLFNGADDRVDIASVVFDKVTLGVVENSLKNFKIFPNPTDEILFIETIDKQIQKIELFDLQGRLLKTINENKEKYQIDISNFLSGTYLIKLSEEKGSQTVKIVKK